MAWRSRKAGGNEELLKKICNYLNLIYTNENKFKRDLKNDFQVYFFWALEYPTIQQIKHRVDSAILEEGRKYLKVIDGENYQEF